MKDDEMLSIGEVANLLGVSIQTLRRWDEKGVLKSFRAFPGGNRFYGREAIHLFTNDLPTLAWKWALADESSEPIKDFYCKTSDVFTSRLPKLELELQNLTSLGIHYSLLTSMVGEIGDNSYAHNLGNWPDILGIFFAYDLNKRVIALADRGRGILTTLKNIKPELKNHREALKVAFTEIISGRFPERRGNGLKSVAQNVLTSDVSLIFRTGDAELYLKKNQVPLIKECQTFHGCYAVLKF